MVERVEMQVSPRKSVGNNNENGGAQANLQARDASEYTTAFRKEISLSQSLGKHHSNFRLSEQEKAQLPSKYKNWRAVLVSIDSNMMDKSKTITEIFKKIGSKVIKNDRLTHLMEKKQELAVNIQRFDPQCYSVLIETLYMFAQKQVITTKESGTCLMDTASLQSHTNNQIREKIDQYLSQIQTIVGVCFGRLMSPMVLTEILTRDTPIQTAEIDKVCDQVQLLADLYIFLVDEAPQVIRKDFIESMIHFAKMAIESIRDVLQNDSQGHFIQQQSQSSRGQRPMKLYLIEKVIYACITVSAVINELTIHGPDQKRLFETIENGVTKKEDYHDVLIWQGQLILSIQSLNHQFKLDGTFQGELLPHFSRHLIFDRTFYNKLVRNMLDDNEIDRRGKVDYESSLLHLALQVAVKYSEVLFGDQIIEDYVPKSQNAKQQFNEHKQEFLDGMLNFADTLIVKQMRFYLSAEQHGIEITGLEAIPEEEEESKEGLEGNQDEIDGKSDMEDFVKQEIMGTGLSFNGSQYSDKNNSMNFSLHSSRESDQIKHTSTKLIRDSRITKNIEQRTSQVPLSRAEQDDWLRINFSLFKLQEILVLRFYNHQNMRDDIKQYQHYFCHLIDLYKIQLYFLMFTNRLAKYIEANSIDFKKIDFLKDMPEKTEKGEFNCTLCHTLACLFRLPKKSKATNRLMFIQTYTQHQIYQILILIRDHSFDAVDQNHYLKVFYLLFLNRLEISPTPQNLQPSQPHWNNEDISAEQKEIANFQKMRKELFISLYMLFKIEFFPEKYLSITEDTFDTESILVIRDLVHIWYKEEIKKKKSISQQKLSSMVISQVNKILVQRQAFLNIVALAASDKDNNKRCIDAICADLQHVVFSQHGKQEGDIYVDQQVTIEMPHHLPPVTATEYKTANSIYSSRLYMLLKLAIAIMSREQLHLDSDKAYHILYQSPDGESHYSSQHTHVNRAMIPVEKNQSFPGTVKEPVGLDSSRGYVSAQGSLSRRQCDDCLKCQFQPFQLSESLDPINFQPLLALALAQINLYSDVLYKQTQQSQQALNQNVVQANLQNNLLEKLNKLDTDHRLQIYNQNKIYISKNVDSDLNSAKQRRAQGQTGFKIMEKMNTMCQRFIIFVLQCKPIANQFCRSMRKNGPPSEFQTGIEKFVKIKDKVFQLMALRNLTFNIDILSNEEESIWPIKQMINKTLEAMQQSWNSFQVQEQATQKFIKEMEYLISIEEAKPQPITPRRMQKMNSVQDASALKSNKNPYKMKAQGNSPFMSTKDIIIKHQEVSDRNRAQFKKQAEIAVSIISLYLTNITKREKTSLLLFERKFIFELLQCLRMVVIQEGSYSLDLNDQILNAFLFEKLEASDPLKMEQLELPILALRYQHTINNDKLFYSSSEFFQKILSFLLQSINEQIKTAKTADTTHPEQAALMMIQTKNTLKTIIDRLHVKIVEPENTSISLLKFARSLTRESINHFKKIYIYLRESVASAETDRLELRQTINKLNQIFVHTFSRMPQAVIMRDFFSFLREIFFYTKQMDQTDHALAMDMLSIMNDSIRRSSQHDLQQTYMSNQSSLMHMQDCFFFSKVTRGVMLLNELQINQKDDLFMGLLFKIHVDQIQDELQLLNQKRYAAQTMNQGDLHSQAQQKQQVKVVIQKMILASFQRVNNGQTQGMKNLDIEVCVNIEKRIFDLSCRIVPNPKSDSRNAEPVMQTIKNMPLDSKGNWNYLLIHFTKKQSVEIVLKNATEPHKQMELNIKDVIPEKGVYLMAIGNNCKAIQQQSVDGLHDLRSANDINYNQSQNKKYFVGRCSLPFFFKGVSEFKNWIKSNNKLQEMPQKDSSKTPRLDAQSQLRQKSDGAAKSENSNLIIFNEVLIDIIVNKKMLGHSELNFTQKMIKSKGRRELALETVRFGFNAQGLQQDTTTKKYSVQDFFSCDTVNAQIIHVHQLMVQFGCLAAIKSYRAAEVLEGLGGFKNVYPLVHFILESNLKESYGAKKPGQLLSKTFEILESYLQENPNHIQHQMNQRNLFGLLRHCITKIGKQNLITKDVLSKLTSIVTNNIIVQYQYKKVESRTVETRIDPENEGGLPRFIYEEETRYALEKRPEQLLKQIRDMRTFYQTFLVTFTHSLLLDKKFLLQSYKQSGDYHSDDSSSQEQQKLVLGRQSDRKKLVLIKIIDMMHNICCPLSLRKSIVVRQRVHEDASMEIDGDNSSNSFMMQDGAHDRSHISGYDEATDGVFTNYLDLRVAIVSEKTVSQLLDLLQVPAILADATWKTLEKIGQCIASSIIFLESDTKFREILQSVSSAHQQDIPITKMKVYLLIISVVLEAQPQERDNPKELQKVHRLIGIFKTMSLESFCKSIMHYVNDQNHSQIKSDQILKLGDGIIERAARKQLISESKRTQYDGMKRALGRAKSDLSDSQYGRVFDCDSDYSASQNMTPQSKAQIRNTTNMLGGQDDSQSARPNKLMSSMRGGTAAFGGGILDNNPHLKDYNHKRRPSSPRNYEPRKISGTSGLMTPNARDKAPDSSASNLDEPTDLEDETTMAALYAKSTFKKVLKRLQEDSSSIWYDHQELELLEYEELCENYDKLKSQCGGITIEEQQKAFFEAALNEKPADERSKILKRHVDQRQFAEAIENPSQLIPNYSYTIAHQKLGFVTQRRVVDKWGRMMLLMPNRKYFKGESKVYLDYHVHDYMDKMLALSLLKDEDYDDLVIPQSQYQDLLNERSNPQGLRSPSPPAPPQKESAPHTPTRAEPRAPGASTFGTQENARVETTSEHSSDGFDD